MSIFTPTLERLVILYPELLIKGTKAITHEKSTSETTELLKKDLTCVLKTATQRWLIFRSLYDQNSQYWFSPSEENFKFKD